MPLVATVEAIRVELYFDDHPPPHFHACCAEFEARIEIGSGQVLNGSLPVAKQRALRAWLITHRMEMLGAWDAVREGRKPRKIHG